LNLPTIAIVQPILHGTGKGGAWVRPAGKDNRKQQAGAGAEAAPAQLEWGFFADRVGPAVRLLRNELTVRITRAQDPFGLHSGALSTMVLVHANPGCSQSHLAHELAMDKSVLVAIVDDLESRGLAKRSRSTSDRRRNSLSLTPEGERTMHEMLACVSDVERPIRTALSNEDYAALIRLLRSAYAALLGTGPVPGE
jgi:DNA-binding MarR family transcriptional regulator